MQIIPNHTTPKALAVAWSANAAAMCCCMLVCLMLTPPGGEAPFPRCWLLVLVPTVSVVGGALLALLAVGAIHAVRDLRMGLVTAFLGCLLGVGVLFLGTKLPPSSPHRALTNMGTLVCYYFAVAFVAGAWYRIRRKETIAVHG